MNDPTAPPRQRPSTVALALAFALVYTSWGTTYLAIKAGVKSLPPYLFGGTRLLTAGILIGLYVLARGQSLRLSRRNLLVAGVAGVFLFVGGNGLITVAEKTVDSGVASILVATTPLWIALVEIAWPSGERLSPRGWAGLLLGLAGVLVLLGPRLGDPSAFFSDAGPLLVLGSAGCWAIGSVILRYGRQGGSYLASATWQMVIGGGAQTCLGLTLGEAGELTADSFTPTAVFAFFYLLIVGSLIGYLAYTWLLQHVSATMAGTYAYINPAVAVLVGWLIGGEAITLWIVGGLCVILAGVALVRTGAGRTAVKPVAERASFFRSVSLGAMVRKE